MDMKPGTYIRIYNEKKERTWYGVPRAVKVYIRQLEYAIAGNRLDRIKEIYGWRLPDIEAMNKPIEPYEGEYQCCFEPQTRTK